MKWYQHIYQKAKDTSNKIKNKRRDIENERYAKQYPDRFPNKEQRTAIHNTLQNKSKGMKIIKNAGKYLEKNNQMEAVEFSQNWDEDVAKHLAAKKLNKPLNKVTFEEKVAEIDNGTKYVDKHFPELLARYYYDKYLPENDTDSIKRVEDFVYQSHAHNKEHDDVNKKKNKSLSHSESFDSKVSKGQRLLSTNRNVQKILNAKIDV